jgi:hypothetical protein
MEEFGQLIVDQEVIVATRKAELRARHHACVAAAEP